MKRGERAYLEPLARLLAPLVAAGSVVIPVPTTRRRAAERGFDQARELARRAAGERDGVYLDVLEKHGSAQRGRGRGERLSARGRFVLRRGVDLPPCVVLIDDVITTGATLGDAAAVLREARCAVSRAVVVARTAPGRETRRTGARLVEA
jgi:predicted amidophosphoribosyltransferase